MLWNFCHKNLCRSDMLKIFIFIAIIIFTAGCTKEPSGIDTDSSGLTGTLTDIDGNVYKTVKIGKQWWMAENLKVTRYCNGRTLVAAAGDSAWEALSSGAYCGYAEKEDNAAVYGLLYNWYAVIDSQGLAPAGWHVPTDEEWKQLEMYLGMSRSSADEEGWRGTDEGGKLKETGTIQEGSGLWVSPNEGASNSSGFSALPGGYRFFYGMFYFLGRSAYFWSASKHSPDHAWIRFLNYSSSGIHRTHGNLPSAFSVRCVKD
jgi:uncharacterized protein (TIGR02145 family)